LMVMNRKNRGAKFSTFYRREAWVYRCFKSSYLIKGNKRWKL
jgi:hypothetical protein